MHVRTWLATAHSAMRALPRMPASVWLIGSGLVVLLGLVRVGRSSARLHSATPAPESVQRMAAQVAQDLGLTNPPMVQMTKASVSPMIWCGRRARLILPERLWADLDPAGRRAVMCHELAHLRRRDHWVRWIELAVSVAYWWHPVVWWVRRRLHDEADASCDVWVTWLMPRGRRVYAQALLATKQFVSDLKTPVPAVGMAVTSGRARPLARRLTMVMTRSCKPKPSVFGLVLAVTLAAAGWVATPALSSPPAAPAPATVSVQAPTPAEAPEAPTYVLVGGDDDLEKRMSHLEKKMEKLSQAMDELLATMESKGSGHGTRWREPRAPRAPRAPKAPHVSQQPAEEFMAQSGKGETIIRKYQLPAGKLKALTSLMVRDDVPVLVSPGDDCITVHGNAKQQKIFEAFVNMIHPDGAKAAADEESNTGWFKSLTGQAALGDTFTKSAVRQKQRQEQRQRERQALRTARRAEQKSAWTAVEELERLKARELEAKAKALQAGTY